MFSVFQNRLLCQRFLLNARSRSFRIYSFNRSVQNVNKLLDDIQNQKSKSRNRTKKKADSAAPKSPTKKSAKSATKSTIDTAKKFDLKEVTLVAKTCPDQSESIFQNECDNSMDIFKDLGLENVESVFDEKYQTFKDFLSTEDDYEIYNDIHMTKQNLISYVHVCIYNDQLAEAHSFVLEFIAKFSNSFTSANIANCCELLIKGWARKGNTDNVIYLKNFIKNKLNLRLTTQIYEYYLLALAKRMKESTPNEVQNVIIEMRKNSLNPEFLFYRSTLNSSEVKIVKDFLKSNYIDLNFRRVSNLRVSKNKLIESIMSQEPKYYDPFEGVDLSEMDKFIEEQFDVEMNSIVKVPPIEAKFYDTGAKATTENECKELITELEGRWRISLENGFKNYLKDIKSKHKRLSGIPFIHYMTIVEPEFFVDIMLEEIRKCASFSEHYSPFAGHLFESLGRKVMYQYLLRSNTNDGTIDDFKKCYKHYVKYTLDSNLIQKYNPREYWQHLLESGCHYYFDESKYWPRNVLKEIGKDLYEIISNETLFDTIDFEEVPTVESSVQPVVSFCYKNQDYKTKKEVRINPLLIKLYEGANSDIHFESERLPMLTPPMPWINSESGGNLLIRNFIIRLPIHYPKQQFKNQPIQQMYPTFDSLNALSLCPWRINHKILDLAIDVFKNRGNLDLDIPVALSHFGSLPRASSGMTSKERAIVYHKRKMQKKEQAEMYSLWVDCMYKLSIGNYLRDRIFWFPMNTDFRSRVYPIPPNFNHLGNDLSRAILMFAKGKPLGEQGLKWLKIHLINLTGLKKKSSSEERLAYCDEIIDLIMDSADHPLDGKRWWMESDEIWQTLACCIELTNAIRSNDPHNYVSHMPIHQDGSCNGLQHYAALGRDVLGAKSVNLLPAKYPQDVYSDVANLVQLQINSDLENNVDIAKIVDGFVSRKIVKHTVMTYVYGVTKYGAKLQVLKRLKEDPKFPEAHKVTASLYLSEKIFHSIRQMFTQTRKIQDWLTNCAQIISTDYQNTVEWVTPIGFPVYQSYFKSLKSKNSGLKLVPNTMKQKNAFPANFIHSLDSTHMMLTSLECHRNGLTFASVHDCYWTHANDIDAMNYMCRKQFVALHSEPILDNLSLYLKHKVDQYNASRKVPEHADLVKLVNQTIPKGEFDLRSVMDSTYFFS